MIKQEDVMVGTHWRDACREKLVSAEQAVKVVKSGDRVLFHTTASEPAALAEALAARAPQLRDVEVVHMFLVSQGLFARPEMQGSFRYNGLFLSPPVRKAVAEGRADYTPCLYREIPRLFRDNILPVDVFLMQITPPDGNGYCSYGLSHDYARAGTESAKIVIAQMNSRYPYTYGDKVHLDEIDYIVEKDTPIFMLAAPRVSEVERRVGENVAGLIHDGDTLQMGIGAIPDTVLSCLKEKNDLGIHSEMFSDGVVDLARAGVITNRKKTLHPGKFIATFLMGTQKLYDFVDHNPDLEMHGSDYVNDPYVIGKNDNLVSINSALQVDLTGQVNAETIGDQMYSGIGGQLDFVTGASNSKGGKSIFAFASTVNKGTISRICFQLPAGAGVTTPRGSVHYVVTEYGIADLRGRSLRQRAAALIEVAHPDFRDQLRDDAKRMNWL
jgi:4-hydroxybutyrate CoA-transferase